MASTQGIRAGRAFVELFADNSKLERSKLGDTIPIPWPAPVIGQGFSVAVACQGGVPDAR